MMVRLFKITFVLMAGAVACFTLWPSQEPSPPDRSGPLRRAIFLSEDVAIHVLRVGFVAVKPAHRSQQGEGNQLLKIVFSRKFSGFMPVNAFVVRIGDSYFLIDGGLPPVFEDAGAYTKDSRNRYFYNRFLRFSRRQNETLESHFQVLGIDKRDIQKMVVTHFHADHIGVLKGQTDFEVVTGAEHLQGHSGFDLSMISESTDLKGEDFGEAQKHPRFGFDVVDLEDSGRLKLVSLAGHTMGHVGALVESGGRAFLIAGDASFDIEQTRAGSVSGISEDIKRARATQEMLAAFASESSNEILFSHSYDSLQEAK